MFRQVLIYTFLLSTLFTPTASVQAEELSVNQMIDKLVPRPRTRGRDVRGIKVEGKRVENNFLNLYVKFDYDTDSLKQDSLITLVD